MKRLVGFIPNDIPGLKKPQKHAKIIMVLRFVAISQTDRHIKPDIKLKMMRIFIGPTMSAIWPARILPMAPIADVTDRTADV
jgi:hypothetical protein